MTPKVSVVVPVYNVECYVEQCIRSLMVQTLTDIEIIVVDDGSSDSCPKLIRELAQEDSRIKVIRQDNAGYGVAVNRGFDEAQGEYVGILESDDFCDEETFELLYTAAKRVDADFAKAPFFFYWSKPERQEPFALCKPNDCNRLVQPLECEYIFDLKPSIWSAIYKKSFLKEQNIRVHETPGASYQDASFNFQVLSLAKRAIFLDEYLVFYRQDNEASSVNSKDKAFVIFDEYAYIERFLEAHSNHPNINRLRELLAWIRFNVYMWNYDRVDPKYHKELAKKMAEAFSRDKKAKLYDPTLLDGNRWYILKSIMANPEAFVEEYDNNQRSTASILREKRIHAEHLIKRDGFFVYLTRVIKKFILRKP